MKRRGVRRLFLAGLLAIFACGALFSADGGYEGWRKIETDHFTLVFEPRDLDSALHVASFADSVYRDLSSLLSVSPESKIPVVIAGRSPWSNGLYSPLPATVVLYVTSPEDRFLGSRTEDWLRSLFVHELTHYLHLNAPVGPAKYLSKVFGPGVLVMNTPFMEGWWVEGITTYTETAFAAGGRGDSSRFALTYEAPLQEGRMWSLGQGAYQGPYAPSGRIYTTGYVMVDYLMDTYGPDLFNRVNSSFAWFPFLGVSHALKKETGISAPMLFTFALEAKAPDTEISSLDSLSPDANGDYYLPDPVLGRLLGFSHTPDDGGHLVSWEEGIPVPVVRLPISDPRSLSVSADGSQAVFSMRWEDGLSRSSLSLAPAGYADLYRLDLETERYSRITERQQLYQPSLSRDGSRLVALQREGTRYRLVEVDQDSKAVTVLYDNEQGSVYEPRLSDDGSMVCAIEVIGGRSALIALDRSGNRRILVGFSSGELLNPRFLPDGNLLFASDERGRFELYRYDLSSDETYRILSDSLGVLGAVADGDRLVVQTYGANGYALRTVPMEGIGSEAVSIPRSDPTPAVGEQMAFSTSAYHDYLQFNLLLPLTDGYGAGIWTHWTSLLRKHQLIAQCGYDFSTDQLQGALLYAYVPGPYALSLAVAAEGRQIGGETDLVVPLWQESGVRAFSQLGLDLGFRFDTGPASSYLGGGVQASYRSSARSVQKDFFGSSSLFSYLGTVWGRDLRTSEQEVRPFGGIGAKVRLPGTHCNLGLRSDLVFSLVGSGVSKTLPYAPELYGTKDGKAKGLFSGTLELPLGLFDQRIPYGGLTAMGLSLSAMTAAYWDGNALLWEDDLYLSASLSAKLILGASAIVKPFVGVTVSPFTGKHRWQVGIDGVLQTGSEARFPW